MFRKIIRNTTLVGLGTLSSRILGLIRDVLLAQIFGTCAIFEAFVVAFQIPNVFRSIFAEGFVDSVALPTLATYANKPKEMFGLANHLITVFALFSLVLTVVGIAFSKYIVYLLAPGFIAQPDKLALAISFTRITFLYLFFITVAANTNALLYAMKRFFIPAFNPVLLNVVFIVGLVFFARRVPEYTLMGCVLVGGLLQAYVPLHFLRKEGFVVKLQVKAAFTNIEVLHMLRLFVPRIWASIVYQLSVFIDTVYSSFTLVVGQGALAAIYYGSHFIQLPLSLIAMSLSRVILVDLSQSYNQKDMLKFKRILVFSFQNNNFFVLPIAIVILAIPKTIIDVVFKRGVFNADSLEITSSVLCAYGVGLLFFCMIKVFVHAFYALKDTVTPAKVATISLLVNVIVSGALIYPLKISGVALGSSIAAMLNCYLLYRKLIKVIGAFDWEETKRQFLCLAGISFVMVIVMKCLLLVLPFNKYLNFSLVSFVGLGIFLILGHFIGLKQIAFLKKWIIKN